MTEKIETVIIGAGQAGLATSYFLIQFGCEHLILERNFRAASVWRDERWDSFTIVTPNWSFRLPGAEYKGDQPNGFMSRNELVSTFEQYIKRYHFPIRYEANVNEVHRSPTGAGFLIQNENEQLQAKNVVVATGLYQWPKIPHFSAYLSAKVVQLHSNKYRNPETIPRGAVLVVGSAQSGSQIAEELYKRGRKVYLSVGNAGRVPRTYRGRDIFKWMHMFGYLDRTVKMLPSPEARFVPLQHLSGVDGGHTINLHQFAHDGVILLGSLLDGKENMVWLAGDLKENLAKADKFEADIIDLIDRNIARKGIETTREILPVLRDGFESEEILQINLQTAGISTIIWATGYSFDYSLVRLPVVDKFGFPIQDRGVSSYPGLFFVGMPWLYKQKSGTLLGVGEDAQYIARVISSNRPGRSGAA